MLFCLVYMWRTLPYFQLQTEFWGHQLPLRTACLLSYRKHNHISQFLIITYSTVNIKI